MAYLKEKETGHLLEAIAYLADLSEKAGLKSWHTTGEERERLKTIFSLFLEYFTHIVSKEKTLLHRRDVQQGLQALMYLTGEIVQKEGAGEDFKEKLVDKMLDVKEYKDLTEFYTAKVAPHLATDLSGEEWDVLAEEDFSTLNTKGLESLAVVRADTDYELFFIRSPEGRPLFTKALLHALKLIGAIEEVFETKEEEGSVFRKVVLLQDKDCHLSAKAILQEITPYLDTYYQTTLKAKFSEGIAILNKTIMALMMASNPRNLMGSALGKSCFAYYKDFDFYLRRVLTSVEYQKTLKLPPNKVTPFFHAFLSICDVLCQGLWMGHFHPREFTTWLENFAIKKGLENKPLSERLFLEDEGIRRALLQHPNQPLLRAVSVFRKNQSLSSFDSLEMGNFPSQLYTVVGEDLHLSVLRMPSPTRQENLSQASITPEFLGFLEGLQRGQVERHHLLFNLQEGVSWKDHARAAAIESLAKEAPFDKSLIVVTLPRSGDFYMQRGEYENLDPAHDFLNTFHNQLLNGKSAGYFFSAHNPKEWTEQIEDLLREVHTHFFHKKDTLSHQERVDFIELFYLFFSLKLIGLYRPDSCSFTCKDGIDQGMAAAAELFVLLKFINQGALKEEDHAFLLGLLYTYSMQLRGRALLKPVLHRVLGVMSRLDGAKKDLPKFLPASFLSATISPSEST